jgi:hypothetical protein
VSEKEPEAGEDAGSMVLLQLRYLEGPVKRAKAW